MERGSDLSEEGWRIFSIWEFKVHVTGEREILADAIPTSGRVQPQLTAKITMSQPQKILSQTN
jgi:hypothetical protein